MTDITERLREAANEIARNGHAGWGNQMTEAADEIDRLRARVAELEAADGECFTGMIVP